MEPRRLELLTIGQPTPRRCGVAEIVTSIEQRFFSKIEVGADSECWWWVAAKSAKGYGWFWASRHVRAHRWSYEHWRGPIPQGLQIDHLCRNPSCVRPSHLEPVTRRTNILRGEGVSAQNARKTQCLRGHPFSGANLYVAPSGRRDCRLCHRNYDRKRRPRQPRRALSGGSPRRQPLVAERPPALGRTANDAALWGTPAQVSLKGRR